ncbi:hypothetical protein [Accumulibacter sp.]|uniref:hypothetical protein n=1 Tax=Accumulibacter sp. TaxID=2053492 RepID=UPI0025D4ACE2|nr:hypothetical protein [Accumulibacter sp.]MCP5230350.1 hypothetical protein [Accumulibacter sp.]
MNIGIMLTRVSCAAMMTPTSVASAAHSAPPHEHENADAEDDQQPVLSYPFHVFLLCIGSDGKCVLGLFRYLFAVAAMICGAPQADDLRRRKPAARNLSRQKSSQWGR